MSVHASYGEKSYWDTRYGGEQIDTYEWYMSWSQLRDVILKPVHEAHSNSNATNTTNGSTAASSSSSDSTTSTPAAASSSSSAAPIKSATSTAATSNVDASADSAVAASASSSSSAAPAASTVCSRCQSLRYLIVGCGNSELSAAMYHDGFTNLTSLDYSEVVINKMRQLYASTPALAAQFIVGDCRNLPLSADGEYDVIIDKGTLDAILCGSDSNKHQAGMLIEMHRVLKPSTGVFVLITYGQPSARLPYLEKRQYLWDVEHVTLGPTRFLYACKKHTTQT